MKKIFILALMLAEFYSIGQATKSTGITASGKSIPDIPSSLLTDEETFWTTSTLSSLGYVSTMPGLGYNNYKSADGMVVKLRFTEDNHFKFLLYVQANCYGTNTETWTEVEGTVQFTKDDKGQNVFITKAEKGSYRTSKDGRTTAKAIRENELKSKHSNTYLWERIDFPDDPSRKYLLTVNLDEHPAADVKVAGSIDRSWVTRFSIPVKK